MYPVTQEFNDKILAPIRKVYGRVEIDYTDPFLDQSITVDVNEKANVSYPQQTADSVKEPIGKIASLDGSWVLDGSYKVISEIDQLGWWGKQLAGIEGLFYSPYPTLTVNFISRSITKLNVVGDSARKEYPVDFTINLYNLDNNLLYTETVTSNNKVGWEKILDNPVTQVTKMELIVTKWSHPGRQVKILEFFTSIKEVYEGEDIISLNLLEEMSNSINSLPVGSVSSNEITLNLKNDYENNRKFDNGNTQSPLYEMLKPNRRIKAYLGIERDNEEKEMVPLGIFWSGDWDVPEDNVYAKTTGRDRLKFLSETEYSSDGVLTDISLYDLSIGVLEDAGLTTDEYWVDDELKDYIIPYVLIEDKSHRDVLRMIAEASLGHVYCDRNGVIRVAGTKPISEQYDIQVSENANVSYSTQLTDGVEVPGGLYISLDGSWNLNDDYIFAPTVVEEGQLGWWGKQLSNENGYFNTPYPTITMTFHDKAIGSVKIVGDTLRGEFPVDYIITVYDSQNNVLSQQYITGNTNISNSTLIPENPTNAAKITVEFTRWSHSNRQAKILECIDVKYSFQITPEDYFTKNNPAKYSEVTNYVEVETQPINSDGQKLSSVKVVVKDEESIAEYGLKKFTLSNNLLIQTESMALEIANRLLGGFKNPRRNLELDWRGNPSLLLGDTVTVIDNREKNNYKIFKQELEYAGSLRSKLTGRRT